MIILILTQNKETVIPNKILVLLTEHDLTDNEVDTCLPQCYNEECPPTMLSVEEVQKKIKWQQERTLKDSNKLQTLHSSALTLSQTEKTLEKTEKSFLKIIGCHHIKYPEDSLTKRYTYLMKLISNEQAHQLKQNNEYNQMSCNITEKINKAIQYGECLQKMQPADQKCPIEIGMAWDGDVPYLYPN